MAKCTITITDLPGDKVQIIAEPNFATMMEIDNSGNRLTSAHGMAFALLNHARDLSKKNDPIVRKIPIIRGH